MGDSFVTSCCCTLPVQLLDSPVTSCLSSDRHHGTCSRVLGGISSIVLFSITVSVMSQTFCMSGVFPVGFPTGSFPVGFPTVSFPVGFPTVLFRLLMQRTPLLHLTHNFRSCFCILVYASSYYSYDSSGTLS